MELRKNRGKPVRDRREESAQGRRKLRHGQEAGEREEADDAGIFNHVHAIFFRTEATQAANQGTLLRNWRDTPAGPVQRHSHQAWTLRACRLDIDGDVAPSSLLEADHAQHGTGEMPENDGEPDVSGLET